MKYDIAVIGSGFGGSLTAMIARKLGLSVIMIEKNQHPRFVIGESTTPLTNLYLEELTDRYGLTEVRKLSKFGSWQKAYPDVAVGLKRGFSFFHHEIGKPFHDDETHRNQLLVAANPNTELGDTQWYRPEFDHLLVKLAEDMDVDYREQIKVTDIHFSKDKVNLVLENNGREEQVHTGFVVDATGPDGFLARKLDLPGGHDYPDIPARQGLFTHFKDVGITMDWIDQKEKEQLPYHPDHAAVHLLFKGGWIWMLRFNNGIVSAGVSLNDDMAEDIHLEEGAIAWERLISQFPSIHQLFKNAKAVHPFQHMPNMSYRCDTLTGPQWAMLPSAAGFIDPMMSTGFPLNIRGIMRIARVFEHFRDDAKREKLLVRYQDETKKDQNTARRMIAALLTHIDDFELFSAISMLYFAAASYSESAIRLKKTELAPSFLLDDHPEIGPAFRKCYQKALTIESDVDKKALVEEICEAIQSINVAGLCDERKRNWYPVNADDLLKNASKLNATKEDVQENLKSSGFPI